MDDNREDIVDWNQDMMLEIEFSTPDKFLVIKETLTRIGIVSNKTKSIFQTCHILHKQGRYFIVHFKEMFALDGKTTNITNEDIERRNIIALLLEDWGLLGIVDRIMVENVQINMNRLKVVSAADKGNWNLVPKYNITGRRKS